MKSDNIILNLDKKVEEFQELLNTTGGQIYTEYFIETYCKKNYDLLSTIKEFLRSFYKSNTSHGQIFELKQQEFDFLLQNETQVIVIEDWQDDMSKWFQNYAKWNVSYQHEAINYLGNSIQNIINEVLNLKAITVSHFKSKLLQTDVFRYWGYIDSLDYLIETDELIIHLHLDCSD